MRYALPYTQRYICLSRTYLHVDEAPISTLLCEMANLLLLPRHLDPTKTNHHCLYHKAITITTQQAM